MVSKEMYTFLDRGETSITLKPEMTASVVRAYLEHSLGKQQVLNKLYYISPMFRQERPQAGRFRQFNQFGAEALGSEDPSLDAEMIIMSYDILKELGLKDLTIKINSLGVPKSREKYKKLLREYLEGRLDELSEESKKRVETNILRVLDSKDERDIKVVEDAPMLIEHLDDESLEHFEKVKQILLSAGVSFEIDPKLVRGLDYYTHTTFELISGKVGSQSALLGGGRYDNLVEELGGKSTPGVGFAAGIERILLACENEACLNLPEQKLDVYFVRLDKELAKQTYDLSLLFRRKGLNVELDYALRSVKAQMREANKLNARFVLFFGGEEYENDKIRLKNMETSEEQTLELTNVEGILKTIKGA
ncbi:MAG: histidine--tRNA ligase [Melioribacteraceae bacterium]|nr:histidine--tRNA ligase [Melioribacteraceae bacterium]